MVQWIKEYGSKVIKRITRPQVDAVIHELKKKYPIGDSRAGLSGAEKPKRSMDEIMADLKANPRSTSKGRDALMGDLATRRQLMTK